MKVKVQLVAGLRMFAHNPKDEFLELELPDGATAEDIISRLKLPRDECLLFLRNGIREDLTTPLQDGDQVAFFPPISGG